MIERIIEKFGSACHFNEYNEPDYDTIRDRIREIERDMKNGKQSAIVASGAVAFGMRYAGDTRNIDDLSLHEKQLYAGWGQQDLMGFYRKICSQRPVEMQISIHDFYYSDSIGDSLDSILKQGILPVINANDVTDLHALRAGYYGEVDNDITSTWILNLVDADLLVKRCRYPGFIYNGELVREIQDVAGYWESCGTGTSLGSGGGTSTLKAAQGVLGQGKTMAIAHVECPRYGILNNTEDATWIPYYPN